tara:strand:- start:3501 stop:4574 length:1074 start_codon:yes stop_codon:yes gene_type:complete
MEVSNTTFKDRMLKHGVKKSANEHLSDADGIFLVKYRPAGFLPSYTDHESFGINGLPDMNYVETPLNNKGEPAYKFAVREDLGSGGEDPVVLGLHGHGYAEENSYVFLADMADEMFPDSTINCTIFDNGERCMLVQEIGDPIDLGDGDVIRPNIAWTASFNGTWSTGVFDFSSRVFCSNMLNMGRALFKVRRTLNHKSMLDERCQIVKSTIERFEKLAVIARVLKDSEFTDMQFYGLMEQILPEPEGKNGEPPHPQAQRHHEERSMAILDAWGKEKKAWGSDHTFEQEDDTHTNSWSVTTKIGNRWLAYNAVQGAEQHYINAGYKPRRVKNQHKALTKAVDGKSPLGDKALTLLSKG